MKGKYKTTPATGTCRYCGATFRYMRRNLDRLYCNEKCKSRKRAKYALVRYHKPPAAAKLKLIPYAGKE